MKAYLYRRGDGNEGNFKRAVIMLKETDDPYAALIALVANDYIPGKRVRRHIIRNIEIDGEPEFNLYAMVLDGPDGEQAFGAAWLTAELKPIAEADIDGEAYPLRKYLDPGALNLYRREAKRQ